MKKITLILAAAFALGAAAFAFDGYVTGYVDDKTDEDEFALLADSKDLNVVFDWPEGADFWVTVYGRDHNELAEFDLNEGDTINLTGGGLFYLEVFAKDGFGEWSAEWTDTD